MQQRRALNLIAVLAALAVGAIQSDSIEAQQPFERIFDSKWKAAPVVNSLAFSKDGKWLYAACNGGPLRIWERDSGKEQPAIEFDTKWHPVAVQPSDDGDGIIVGCQQFNRATGWRIYECRANGTPPLMLIDGIGDEKIAAIWKGGTKATIVPRLEKWDERYRFVKVVDMKAKTCRQIHFDVETFVLGHEDGSGRVAMQQGNELVLFDLNAEKAIRRWPAEEIDFSRAVFVPKAEALVLTAKRFPGEVRVLNTRLGTWGVCDGYPTVSHSIGAAIPGRPEMLLLMGEGIMLFDVDGRKSYLRDVETTWGLSQAAVSPDERSAAVAGHGWVRAFRLKTGN